MTKNIESGPTEDAEDRVGENQVQVENQVEQPSIMSDRERQSIEQRDAQNLSQAKEQIERAFSDPTIEQMNSELSHSSMPGKLQEIFKERDKFNEKLVEDSGLKIGDNVHDSSTWQGRVVKWFMGRTPREREKSLILTAVLNNMAGDRDRQNQEWHEERKQRWYPFRNTFEKLFYGKTDEYVMAEKIRELKRIREEKNRNRR